ncbi:MAG: GNAT family N-acetyltransferase [archaeon]
MKIREARLKDIKRINEISLEGIFQENSFQYTGNKKKVKEEADYEFKKHKRTIKRGIQDKKQYWIVAEEKGIVVGFGSAYIKKDKGVTESVYIDKEFQRRGYGAKILNHLVKWLKSKNLKHIDSYLLTKNFPSLKLHKKIGFKPHVLRMKLK